MNTRRILLLLVVLLAALAVGCQRAPKKTTDVPPVLSHQYSISVMPFTQPRDTCEMIMGQMPENQGCINPSDMAYLDVDLREMLRSRKNGRQLSFASLSAVPSIKGLNFRASAQPAALKTWAEVARRSGKDFILVPLVIDWQERDGNEGGVKTPARVHLEMYLIRSATGTIQRRVIWEEEQVGLADNLLTVGDFFKRRGQWVSGRELAQEGIAAMLKELGL